MKKVLYITILTTVIFLCLQGLWTYNMYKDYVKKQQIEIASIFPICVNKELSLRELGKFEDANNPRIIHKEASVMSPEERAQHKGDTLDLSTLHRNGVGNSINDVIAQLLQDEHMNKGKNLQLSVLDSIFKESLQYHSINAHYYIATYNSDTIVTATVGDLPIEVDRSSTWALIPIGTQGKLFVQMKAEITLSGFFKQQYLILGLSALLVLIVVICILWQLITIRCKNKLFTRRETCVNGTIHDLKAPLGNIWMLLQYIKPKIEDLSQQNLIEQATIQLGHLKRDIESLLITARTDRQQLFLQKKHCQLSDIVEEARQIILTENISKSFQLEVKTLPDGSEATVEVDAMYIRNLVLNLIYNALKYSDEPVCITIEVAMEGDMAVLSVQDNGWGIDKKYQKKIFNQFYQIPAKSGKRQNGYGIGLAYVRYILKQHKGTITVDSQPGVGSTFVCRIPLV